MKFAWDEYKNIINKEKHKISFETAAYVFDDPNYRNKNPLQMACECHLQGFFIIICWIFIS